MRADGLELARSFENGFQVRPCIAVTSFFIMHIYFGLEICEFMRKKIN